MTHNWETYKEGGKKGVGLMKKFIDSFPKLTSIKTRRRNESRIVLTFRFDYSSMILTGSRTKDFKIFW